MFSVRLSAKEAATLDECSDPEWQSKGIGSFALYIFSINGIGASSILCTCEVAYWMFNVKRGIIRAMDTFERGGDATWPMVDF